MKDSRGPCQGAGLAGTIRAGGRALLVWIAGILAISPALLAYDGPDPITYDRTIDTIRVVMTTQGKIAEDGLSRFSMVAHVPISTDAVGQVVDLEIRGSGLAGTSALVRCTFVPQWVDVGSTVAIPCDRYVVVPHGVADGPFSVYPYVLRRSSGAQGQRVHDGAPFKIPVSIVLDDGFEDNDSTARPASLGALGSATYADLISRDADFYRFSVPANMEVAAIGLQFRHAAADLDLWIYEATGQVIAVSDGYSDREFVVLPVTPGSDYLVRVVNFSDTPAFYDLEIAGSSAGGVSISAGPVGAPNPAAPGSLVSLSVDAVAGDGSQLAFEWGVACPGLPSSGLVSAFGQIAQWSVPANTTGVQQPCVVSVTARGATGQSDAATYTHFVDPVADGIHVQAGPSGTPDPTPSRGQVTLSVTAVDLAGHPLGFEWRSYCPFALSGTFLPDAFAPSPVWIAPSNTSGAELSCQIEVRVFDAFHHSATASYAQRVAIEDVVSIVAGPNASPNPVESGGSVALSTQAADSHGHAIRFLWSAQCALGSSGTFIPSREDQNPTWIAPTNVTGLVGSCTVTVRAADDFGKSASRSTSVLVNSIPDVVVITTAGPVGPPSAGPVPSGGSVPVAVSASDSIGHALSGSWQASCPGLPSAGTFVPGPAGLTALWNAPGNFSGAPVTCTLEVTVRDPFDRSAVASFGQVIDLAPHTLSFANGPTGTPSLVASQGTVLTTLAAGDSYGHPLTFEWTANCAGLPGLGVFAPSHSAATPAWVAPENLTGALRTCTLQVTVRDDQGSELQGSFDVTVDLAADVVTITSGPTGAPSIVPSSGSIALSVTATDPYDHPLTYAWQGVCPGLGGASGSFSAASAAPSWTAPENRTGAEQTCTLSVVVADSLNHTATASVTIRVNSIPDAITIDEGPVGSTEPLPSGAEVLLTLSATDALGHPLQYLWWASCPAVTGTGTFAPTNTVRQPTWRAPMNRTGSQQSCTLNVKVSDGRGISVTRSFVQRVDSVPHTLAITAGPTASPSSVASRGAVDLRVGIDDSLLHDITRRWEASCPAPLGQGAFSAMYSTTVWNAPANLTGGDLTCSLTLTATDGFGQSVTASLSVVVLAAVDQVTITSGPTSSSNPVPSGRLVMLGVSADDPFDHPLSYTWSASCGQGAAGQFSPNASAQTPTWQAPTNTTGTNLQCVIQVTITDGHGHSATAGLSQIVQPPNVITITLGPGLPPSTADPGSTLPLSATATDTLGRPLTFAWSGSCPGLSSSGAFSSPSSATSSWLVPLNVTGADRTCTITVAVTDTNGEGASRSFNVRVPPQNTVTITAPAAVDQDPIPSGGSVRLEVGATDTQGRTLSYWWRATCPGLPSGGTFDVRSSSSPTWTAPENRTGTDITCTLEVTVTNDQGLSRTSTISVVVISLPQSLSMTTGPTGTPNPVVSFGTVQLAVVATDVWGRPLAYTWSAVCPALGGPGTFDNPASATARWTAPTNETPAAQVCTLTLTVTDDRGHMTSRVLDVIVGSALQILGTPTQPGDNPNAVSPGGSVDLSVVGGSLPGQTLTYLWTAICPGLSANGTFTSPGTPTSTWLPPANTSGDSHTCTLTLTTTDGQGQVQVASLNVVVLSGPGVSCTITVSPTLLDVPSVGASPTVQVGAQDGCPWTALSASPWIQVTAGAGGTGSGQVALRVEATPTPGPRTGTVTIAGLDVQIRQAGLGYTYYLAEGATIGGFFDTLIALLNPDLTRAASVTVEFQLKDSSVVLVHTLAVGPHQRATLDVKNLGAVNPALLVLSSAEFSTVVHSDLPLVVDRTMTWDARAYGGHSETAIDAPASTWYFAEGATIGAFELYYLIQNPNPVPLDNEIEVTYLLPPPAAPIVRTYSMGANTRRNIAVHVEPGLEDAEVSAIIRTPGHKPVIAERAMYLTTGDLFYGAGHESAGIRSPRTEWFFAEGATGDFFDLFVLIGNPNDTPARVTATFLFDDGTTCSKPVGNASQGGSLVVGPKSRQNVWVDLEVIPGCPRSLAHAAVSTTISSDLPIVAERTMWWPGPTAATWAEAHNSPGATAAGTVWAIADGEQGGARAAETYVLVANTSPFDGSARVTLHFEDGTSVEKVVELLANSRTTVPIGAGRDPVRLPLGAAERPGFGFGSAATNRRFGIVVESLAVTGNPEPAGIVVERATYWNAPGAPLWGGGTNALATRLR